MSKINVGHSVSLLSVLLLAGVSAVYLVFGVAHVDTSPRTHVTLVLDDAAQLVPHSPVLRSGIEIGSVTEVRNADGRVRIGLQIDDDVRLPLNSPVTIETLSALGEPYINFGAAPADAEGYIRDGQLLQTAAITTPASIPEVAQQVTTLLSQLDGDRVGSLLDTFDQSMEGVAPLVPELARAGELLSATLISRMPALRELMENAQVPAPDFGAYDGQMQSTRPHIETFGVKVQSVVDKLAELLYARPVPDAYTSGNGVVRFMPKLDERIDHAGPGLQRLYPVLGPLLGKAGNAVSAIDISALTNQALAAVDENGAVRLQVLPK